MVSGASDFIFFERRLTALQLEPVSSKGGVSQRSCHKYIYGF